MKYRRLVDSILRALDTDCSFSDGAGLAVSYNDAVEKLNKRMETVATAIGNGEVSEAMRLLDEPPGILSCVNCLDFVRVNEWNVFCADRGYMEPIAIDNGFLTRILDFGNSAELIETSLKNYRRAARLGETKEALQSLRYLVGKDKSQDWRTKCIECEKTHLQHLAEEYAEAKDSNNAMRAEEIADEVLDGKWCEEPKGKFVNEIKAEKEAHKKESLQKELRENLQLLKDCKEKEWRPRIVAAMIRETDAIVANGIKISREEKELLEACRERHENELKAKEQEERWKSACETLYAAVERENADEIRDALSAPAFLDKEPTEELLRGAQNVLRHEMEAKRRKMTQISVCVIAFIAVAAGASGIFLKKKIFTDRCIAEAQAIEKLTKGPYAIDRTRKSLARLKRENEEVYNSPQVIVYEQKLANMIEQNIGRTNEIVTVLQELAKHNDDGWKDVVEKNIDDAIARIEKLIKKEEEKDYRRDFVTYKTSWVEFQEKQREAKERQACQMYDLLGEKLKHLAEKTLERLMTPVVKTEIAKYLKMYEDWKSDFSKFIPEKSLDEEHKCLQEAIQKEKNCLNALESLNNAKTAEEILEARKALMTHYANFEEIKHLKELPFSRDEMQAFLEGRTSKQLTFKDNDSEGIPDSEFRAWLADNVAILEDVPSYYDLWGVQHNFHNSQGAFIESKLVAFSLGKPSVSEKGAVRTESECLLISKTKEMGSDLEKPIGGKTKIFQMKTNEESKECVDRAKSHSQTRASFIRFAKEKIEYHLSNYDNVNATKATAELYPPYKRICMVKMYMNWMKELGGWPSGYYFADFEEKINEIATPVRVTGIPNDLTWACYWEPRIKTKNGDAAKFFASMKTGWSAAWSLSGGQKSAYREIRTLKLVEAGKVKFLPTHSEWKKNNAAIFTDIAPEASVEAPVYVIRKEGNHLVLKRAFVYTSVSAEDKGKWRFSPGMAKSFFHGEPLFQLESSGRRVDGTKELERILKDSGIKGGDAERMRKQFFVR